MTAVGGGMMITMSRMRICGCVGAVAFLFWQPTGGAQAPRPVPGVTFSKDVAPIFNANCVSCHQPGEIAPMSLMTYEAARPWARSIRKAVADRVMPPWHADPQHGEFANDPRLSDKDVATILGWVDGGAVQGDIRDLPPAVPPRAAWKIGTPDLVLTMLEPAEVPATGTRIIKDYAIEPVVFEEDRYVERIEVIPSNRLVTHHAILSVRDGDGSQRLGGYQPGGVTTTYPAGVVRKIPKGTTLGLNMHYNTKGSLQTDQTKIGLVFARGRVEQVVITGMTGTRALEIPAGDPNYEAKGNAFVFQQDSQIISLMPRMNERGKDYKYTLVYPDGRSVVLLSIPKFNPDWQPSYLLKTAIAAPKGSRLESIAHYDNSPNNKWNPDPSARIVYGPEIMNGYVDYTIDSQRLSTTQP